MQTSRPVKNMKALLYGITIIAIISGLVFLGCGMVAAGQGDAHRWDLQAGISYIRYTEPDVMKNDGVMYGITGSYAYHNGIMVKAEGQGDWGRVHYSSARSGDYSGINNYIVDLRLLGGYDFTGAEAVTLTPYLGFGYRYLNDDAAGIITSGGYRGYVRESNYYYIPVGLYVERDFKTGWVWGLKVEYDYFWKGLQKSRLTDAGAAYDVENSQPGGYGLRGALSCWKAGDRFDYLIEPYAIYWNIDRSEPAANGGFRYWEPENNTLQYGIKFGMVFSADPNNQKGGRHNRRNP
jgi:hypothetical protein